MKVITEMLLRDELRASEPEVYYIPEGKLLSPAAREYLQQRKIKIVKGPKPEPQMVATPVPPMPKPAEAAGVSMRFVDFETGAYYPEKPEHMTHLHGNVLVPKSHPRIVFRGKLDSLQALIVLAQATLAEAGEPAALVEDLGDILRVLQEMMRCDVLDQPFANERIIGLTHPELREHSHNPMKFYNIQQMILPSHTLGKTYALLNQVRAAVRETEVSAVQAFQEGRRYTRGDIVEELNRLSSALHIILCKHLAGAYR